MRVRVIGLPDEIAPIVEALNLALDVVEVSAPYPCRGSSHNVRVYAELRPLPESGGGIAAELRQTCERIERVVRAGRRQARRRQAPDARRRPRQPDRPDRSPERTRIAMTTRTLTAPRTGPVLLSVDLPHGAVKARTEPGRAVAEVTVTTDDPALAEAVRDTELIWNPGRDELIVRVPDTGGAHTTVISHGGGSVDIGDGTVTINGMTITGGTVVGGPVGTVTVTALLPERSGLATYTRSADVDADGTFEGVKATSTSGAVGVTSVRCLIANTASGSVCADVAEIVAVHTKSGTVNIGHTVDVSVSTKSGAITVTRYASFGAGGTAHLEAVSGHIALTASGPGDVTARSVSGHVDIDAGPHLDPATLTVRASSRTGRVRTPAGAR
ncbi:DUF4097 family beta strand repeat-containing protein [Actinomadura rupiterrae]|uniref:DUF4097 family beta strand repeat-containing protein n=1 Tax=Actinomadura rupiterrae TaxID=559627 RepID=UPI0020A23D9C|nr:DUF4097 family beta strand repeat-containing protein [Actinomadura rupiterrae]MCP2336968.1 hypothetical protein [Actinomadura rupiterrae]